MDRLIKLSEGFGLNFRYDDENMYFGIGNGSRIDKMLDRVNAVVDNPIDYFVKDNEVVIKRTLDNEHILYISMVCIREM